MKQGIGGVAVKSFLLALSLIVVTIFVLSIMTFDGTCPAAETYACSFTDYLGVTFREYGGSFFSSGGLVVIGLFLVLFWPVSFVFVLITSRVQLRTP